MREISLQAITRELAVKYNCELMTSELLRKIELDIEMNVLRETGNVIKIKLAPANGNPTGVQLEDIIFCG